MSYPDDGTHSAAIGGAADAFRFCSVTINGGTVTAETVSDSAAIGAGHGNSAGGSVTINGGNVTARADGYYNAAIGAETSSSANVTINGGVVAAYGQNYAYGISTGFASDPAYSVILGWTDMTDSIYASSYRGTVAFAEHKYFMRTENGDYVTTGNIGGVTIVPLTEIPHNVTINTVGHVSVSADAAKATEGQIVTVTSRCDYPYAVNGVNVQGAGGNVAFTQTGPSAGTFCMPYEDVSITVYPSQTPDRTIKTSEDTVVCRPIVRGIEDYNSDWYYVSGEVEIGGRIKVHGDVKIYLCEGALLNCSGITVQSGNSLTIDGTGALRAVSATDDPGIGGVSRTNCGTIVIRGGVIEAIGGSNAAGIGSDNDASCGSITICGGTVTAVGGYLGAGIGTGAWGNGGSVAILGGKVTARSKSSDAPGIGTGTYGNTVSVLLGWTHPDDYISVSSISGNIRFADGQYFWKSGTGEIARQ